jgi:SAM-dependent methyltransferase
MFNSLLVRIFGFQATLQHGDALVWDRWRWLRARIRYTENEEKLLDVGCGSGAFAIGLAKQGYNTLGLSWDQRNQDVAELRAKICKAPRAKFEICDVRELDTKDHLFGQFDIITCTENIEHIIDDLRLMKAIGKCVKPGGRLLLTTPWIRAIPQSFMEYGPFPDFEDGRHVRRGYSRKMLEELLAEAGLVVEEFSFVSGPISQLSAWIMARVGKYTHPGLAWLVVLPLRPLPALFDKLLMRLFGMPPFCIAVEAYKPKYAKR